VQKGTRWEKTDVSLFSVDGSRRSKNEGKFNRVKGEKKESGAGMARKSDSEEMTCGANRVSERVNGHNTHKTIRRLPSANYMGGDGLS